jgi:hypothetical protein
MTRDHGDVGARRATPPPAFFCYLLQTKALRQIDPWEALARRLGDAWATLGSPNPKPKPNPSRQRVAMARAV